VVVQRFFSHAAGVAAICLWGLLSLTACGASSASGGPNLSASLPGYGAAGSGAALACWQPLLQRLQQDPAAPADARRYFAALPEYSPSPMGAKIRELFIRAFIRRPKPEPGGVRQPPQRIYRNVVTLANMEKCRAFLTENRAFFDAVEQKHPVPREILVSLLFVETRLGAFLGNENAFWSLACMAAADTPEAVRAGLGDIPISDQHGDWLRGRLADKSAWAYKELRALLAWCSLYNLDPLSMPGSVYGAIGLCQFMPSNLSLYAQDGDGDGVINLFSPGDAIFSAANYLRGHGWRAGAGVEAQRHVLKRYNNLTIYADTILALAESLRTGVVQTGPPDAPKRKAAAAGMEKKDAPRTGKAKKTQTGKPGGNAKSQGNAGY
jgi:membrane-bound lytic murein transglycosylase B